MSSIRPGAAAPAAAAAATDKQRRQQQQVVGRLAAAGSWAPPTQTANGPWLVQSALELAGRAIFSGDPWEKEAGS